jgi:hypothetical protein
MQSRDAASRFAVNGYQLAPHRSDYRPNPTQETGQQLLRVDR